MRPSDSFLADLRAYDPRLRCRFGTHTARWFIERQMPSRNPAWVAERPNPWGKSARARDLWQGWQEGYLLVLAVDRALLNWQAVAPALAQADREQAGDWAKLNDRMDAAEAAWEAGKDRAIRTWSDQAAYEAYDHLAWADGRRVSLAEVAEPATIQHPDGFLIRDRRVTV